MPRPARPSPKDAAPAPPAPGCCGTCRFWLHRGEDGVCGPVGECRRHPPAGPVRRPTAHGPFQHHPITDAAHWCGEHAPAPNPATAAG